MSNIAYKLKFKDSLGWTFFGMLTTIVAGITAFCLVCFIAIVIGSRAYGRTTCSNWSAETGIDTKFAVLNWADTGSCLAQTPDGRWVLNSKWQAFVKGDQP